MKQICQMTCFCINCSHVKGWLLLLYTKSKIPRNPDSTYDFTIIFDTAIPVILFLKLSDKYSNNLINLKKI